MKIRSTHFAFLLALLGPAALRPAQAQTVYVPAAVTGYTADVIANGQGSVASSTTNTVDRGNATVQWCFADSSFRTPAGLRPTRALPASGFFRSITTPGLSYQMGPSAGNNSLRIDGAGSGTLTLTNPQPCSEVMVLATEGNGSTAPKVFTVTFTDGSTQVFSNIVVPDWFGNGITPAIVVGSRVNRPNDAIENLANDPSIYEVRLSLAVANYSKSVRSVGVSKTSTDPVLNVMGVSLGSNCLGLPNGGIATANLTSVCPGLPVVLALSGATFLGGITYQWQVSTDGGVTFTDIPGATTDPYTVRPSVTSRYRARVTCRVQASSSTAVLVNVLPAVAAVSYTLAVPPTPPTFCQAGTAPVVTATPAGGRFSSTTGLVIDATTGTLNLAASATGTYTVTYTVTSPCPATGTTTIIVAQPVATLAYNTPNLCRSGLSSGPAASPAGGSFSGSAGLVVNASTGVINLGASTTGTHTVTYVSGGQCPATTTATVTVTEPVATLTYAAATFCRTGTSGTPVATPAGGSFTAPAGVAINASTGAIDLANSTAGTHVVSYLSGGLCPATATASLLIKSDALPTFPNVITPNSDHARNKSLRLEISDVTGYHLQVFNRWGRRIWETTNAAEGWTAEASSAGIYYYQVEYTDCAAHPQLYKGWVEVVK
jgi:hypothetical protein